MKNWRRIALAIISEKKIIESFRLLIHFFATAFAWKNFIYNVLLVDEMPPMALLRNYAIVKANRTLCYT